MNGLMEKNAVVPVNLVKKENVKNALARIVNAMVVIVNFVLI